MNLQDRDSRVIWHPFTQIATAEKNIPIVRAEGVWLFAENGQKYLDGTASWWVNAHGHAHPAIAEALAKQASTLEHIIFAGFTHEPAIELAEKLTVNEYDIISNNCHVFSNASFNKQNHLDELVNIYKKVINENQQIN